MASTNTNYSDKYIESKDYDYYLQLTKSNAAKTCAVNEMASYGLTADITSTGDPNPICPQIQGNCCGPKDQERIKTYWEADNRHQAGYHIAYLKMNRYILGKVKGYQSIAANIIDQSQRLELAGKNKVGQGTDKSSQIDTGKSYSFEYHPMCHEAAKKFNSLDFVDRRKAQNFYDTLNRRANFMQDARRGFYCTLCNAQAKQYISTFRAIFDSRLWYSKDFCQMIYANTFSAIYSIYKSYNPFLKSLLQMMMCIKPKGEGSGNRPAQNQQDNGKGGPQVNINIRPVTIDIDLKLKNPLKDSKLSKAMKEMLDNPLKVTSKFWMEICYNADPNSLFFRARCMGFCENFEMTQASPLMDGDIDALKNVYRTLQEYEFALDAPDTDIFDSDVVALKRGIETEITYLKGNYNFYRALSPTINFSKYKIEFSILKKGHNPMQLSQGTTLEFKYKNARLWHAILGVLCLFMLW